MINIDMMLIGIGMVGGFLLALVLIVAFVFSLTLKADERDDD